MRLDRQRLLDGVEWIFKGDVNPWVYAWLRVAFALLLLVRHSSVLAPIVPLEHHRWVSGLEFEWSVAREPHLVSPLIAGLDLTRPATNLLAWVRTGLAALLLLGIRSRWSALALALVSYWLMLSDRFQYQHHLHLLYFSIAWLALAPLDARLSVEHWLRRIPAPRSVPAWPLVLLLTVAMSVYLAAGTAKLDVGWLSGDTLRALEVIGVLQGGAWLAARDLLGYATLAWLVALLELALPISLALPLTRRAAVACGLLLHLGVSFCMDVSIFGAEMSCLLLAWLVIPRPPAHH
jgi:hypothetical protein